MSSRRRSGANKSRVRARSASPTAVKLQRWIDLLAALLTHRYGLTFEQLQREVPAYAASARTTSEASLLRMFERDKDELRAAGVPIELRHNSEGEELGYHVDPQEVYLPFIALVGSPKRQSLSARRGYRAIRTLAFEPDELHAVFQALDLASSLGDPALAAQCESAHRKLSHDLSHAQATVDADETLRPHRESVGATLRELG